MRKMRNKEELTNYKRQSRMKPDILILYFTKESLLAEKAK